MSLVSRLRGERREPRMRDTFIGPEPENSGRAVSGIVIDGAVHPLDGQPPPARSNGWGDMSWTRRPWRR